MRSKALEQASGEQRETLTGWLSRKDFDHEQKIREITQIFDELQIKKITEKMIRAYYDRALEKLKQLNREEEKKAELYKFASFLLTRER